MPDRIETRIEIKIGNYEIATYSKSHADFLNIITDNPYCNFAIILADTVGHTQKEGAEIKREIMENCGKWYLKETPFDALYSLTKNIKTWEKMMNKNRKKREKEFGELAHLESSCLSYTMFSNKENIFKNIRSGMPSEIILSQNKAEYLKKRGAPPIGYILKSHKKLEIKREMKKGDILLLYSDGLIENPAMKEIIPRKNLELKSESDIGAYRVLCAKEMQKKLKNLLEKKEYKNPSDISNEIIKNLGQWFIPEETPHDDVSIVIVKAI